MKLADILYDDINYVVINKTDNRVIASFAFHGDAMKYRQNSGVNREVYIIVNLSELDE